MILQHKFVETIPNHVEDGIVYVSTEYCTAIHKCVCGCGNEVVTPLSPNGWKLTFDGETISLYPSIGNWRFKCQSHYFITNNMVRHARKWSEDEIRTGKEDEPVKKKSNARKRRKSKNKFINSIS